MRKLNIFMSCLVVVFIVLLFKEPEICKNGIIRGILLSGRVIVPSLFPIMVCLLFLQNANFFKLFDFLNPLTNKIFRLSSNEFCIFLLSLLGGYPVGAKLLSEADLDDKKATLMLNYCINAGPGFIVSAIGFGILKSKETGILLLSSHILSSFFLCFITSFFMPCTNIQNKKLQALNLSDNFVLSTYKASESIFSICSFVILFSGINAYFVGVLKPLSFLLEITNAVTYTKNIYLISFLLGFSGICVWFQIFSSAKKIKINLLFFIISRLFHGVLSVGITWLLARIFGLSVQTISNGSVFVKNMVYSTPVLSLCLLIMAMIFIISLQTKKYAGKITEDMI